MSDLFDRKSIRNALKIWSNSPDLGKHPLAGLQIVQERRGAQDQQFADTPTGRGIVLRQLLREALEGIKPAGETPDFSNKYWRYYFILSEQFVNSRRAQEIREDLGISESGYFTDQRQALEQLGIALREAETRLTQATPASPVLIVSATPPTTAVSLPDHPTPFIGREEELARIAYLLAQADCRLLTLAGPGGIGKTRLGIEAARQAQAAFLDGVYFIPLAPLSEPDFLVTAVAKAIGLTFNNKEDLQSQLGDFLRQKRMLLLFDNFEHMTPATPVIVDLLAQAPTVTLLVTSRERLNIRGEWVLNIHGMTFPDQPTDNLANYSAIQLFVKAVERLQPDWQPLPSDMPAIIRICQLVQGLPLALELAASWTTLLTCDEIASEINQSLDFLNGAFRDLPPRHQSLRAVFAHSWNLLTESEQIAFRKLSVFRGGFDRHAAQQVAGAPLQQLFRLSSKSLLISPRNGRYEVHELLRQYATEKLHESPEEAQSTHHAHACFYANFLQANQIHLKQGGQQKQMLEQVEQEFENIRLAWQYASQQFDRTLLLTMIEPLRHIYFMSNRYLEGVEVFEQLVARCQSATAVAPSPQHLLALALGFQADFAFKLGRIRTARELFIDSLTRLAGHDDQALIGMLAIQSHITTHPDFTAQKLYQQASDTFTTRQDEWALATCYHEMGSHIYATADLDQHDRHTETSALVSQSLELRQRIGDLWGVAACLHYLGHTAFTLGNYAEAKQYIQRTLTIRHEMGDRIGIADAYLILGQIESVEGNYSEAQTCYAQTLIVRQEIGNRRLIAESLDCLGYVAFLSQDNEMAERYYRESLALSQEANDVHGIAWSLHNLADVARRRGEYQQATDLYKESQALHESQDPFDWGRLVALGKLGRTMHAMGNFVEAEHWYNQAVQLALKARRYREAGDNLLGLTQLWLDRGGDPEQAIIFLTAIRNHHATAKDTADKINQLFTKLAAQLPHEAMIAAQTAGQTLSLASVAGQINV